MGKISLWVNETMTFLSKNGVFDGGVSYIKKA